MRDEKDYLVAKSNEMVQHGKMELTVIEQKIINYMISKIKPEDVEFDYISFSLEDFISLCGIQSNNLYYIKENVLKTLADKSWYVYEHDLKSYVLVRWLDEVIINENEVKLKFQNRMSKYLLQLINNGNYVIAALDTYLSFRCKYSAILYDYFRSFVNLAVREGTVVKKEIQLADFKKMLLIDDKYDRFYDLKLKVLTPALKEINKTDIKVNYDIKKRRKKIDSIIFKICPKFFRESEK